MVPHWLLFPVGRRQMTPVSPTGARQNRGTRRDEFCQLHMGLRHRNLGG